MLISPPVHFNKCFFTLHKHFCKLHLLMYTKKGASMYTFITLCFAFFFSFASSIVQLKTIGNTERNPDVVLMLLSEKLNNISSIQYKHKRKLNYPSTAFFNELSGEVYLDFTSDDKVLGTRYYFRGGYLILAFNGSESFICNDVDQSIVINRSPATEYMETLSFLNHSVFSLKKALTWIIEDKTLHKQLSDTIVENKKYDLVSFILTKSIINTLGERTPITNNINITYKILIDRNTYLPAALLQCNNRNSDFLMTTFNDIEVNATLERESLLYYSSYLNRYKEKIDQKRSLIKPGNVSFDWQMDKYGSKDIVSLAGLKGNIVLLDFWICHCSYCITQIPELNDIYKKYKGKNFRLFGVNAYDSGEMIKSFKEKRGPIMYDLLWQADSVRLKYGVDGFPTVILLDKEGVVLYAGEPNKRKIESLINEHL